MSISKSEFHINTSEAEKGFIISVGGSFSFDSHEQFRQAYEHISQDQRQILLDLSKVDEIDSAALGMLVIMHEYLKEKGIKTEIVSVSPVIQMLIKSCEFGKYVPGFTIH